MPPRLRFKPYPSAVSAVDCGCIANWSRVWLWQDTIRQAKNFVIGQYYLATEARQRVYIEVFPNRAVAECNCASKYLPRGESTLRE